MQIKNPINYKFISFEGIEGSGKSTQSRLLNQFLKDNDIASLLTREPGGTKVAEEIRNILINGEIDKLDGITEILLNFAARRSHVENLIKPALNEGKIVISDRFYDSTLAYQGYGHQVDLEIIKQVRKLAIGNLMPDLTFLIDIDLNLANWRIKNRSDNNRYEKMNADFHRKVKAGFLKIAHEEPSRFKIINGNRSIDEIHHEILEILQIKNL